MVRSTTNDFAENLANSILNQSDPETVKEGVPAYLLLIDAMLQGDPNSESLLRTSASLNSSYAGMFSDEPERQKILSQKALDYASKAVCVHEQKACNIQTMQFEPFSKIIEHMSKEDVPTYYVLGTAWAGWIQAHSDDWNAIAQLAQVERIMHRVVELDEGYESGGAHMYLGVIATLLPPAMGGRPEIGREHFERAIALSQGKNLMSKVVYARHYARLVFDRELHDKLIGEVLAADPDVPGFTLINTIAQQQAKQLSASADDYF
ncbi:TRAP transporter TatT component family protein [Kaarinaea lacus]